MIKRENAYFEELKRIGHEYEEARVERQERKKQIIDTLGGIDMEVTQDEIDYINYQMYKNEQTDDPHTIKDAPGMVHLNGQEALWYARNRGLTKGEDDRRWGDEEPTEVMGIRFTID